MSEFNSMDGLVGASLARFARDETTFEWGAFAREAKRAANYACQLCRQSCEHMRLVVHHPFYVMGRRKWEYELKDVQVLCQPCHDAMHERLNDFRRYVFGGLTPESMRVLNGALTVGVQVYGPMVLARAVAELVSAPGAVERFSAAWREVVRTEDFTEQKATKGTKE